MPKKANKRSREEFEPSNESEQQEYSLQEVEIDSIISDSEQITKIINEIEKNCIQGLALIVSLREVLALAPSLIQQFEFDRQQENLRQQQLAAAEAQIVLDEEDRIQEIIQPILIDPAPSPTESLNEFGALIDDSILDTVDGYNPRCII